MRCGLLGLDRLCRQFRRGSGAHRRGDAAGLGVIPGADQDRHELLLGDGLAATKVDEFLAGGLRILQSGHGALDLLHHRVPAASPVAAAGADREVQVSCCEPC